MVAFLMFVLIWLSPFLLTVALSGPADKRHLAEKKVSWYLKKNYLKNWTPFFIGYDY